MTTNTPMPEASSHSTPMVEDALKFTRNLHRLILTVSVVALIFSLSLNLPHDKVQQKLAIDTLLDSDFSAYDTFAKAQIEKTANQLLAPITRAVNKELEDNDYLIFNINHIGDAFMEPLHVGKIRVSELILNELNTTTLSQLQNINSLNLTQDIQVVIPETNQLMAEISAFLEQYPGLGKRIESVDINASEFVDSSHSFIPNTTSSATLYFELVDSVQTGGSPVFNASFPTSVISLPNTSFIYWLQNHAIENKSIEINGNTLVFLPQIESPSNKMKEQKLGELSLSLQKEIAKTAPENNSASILGTKIPGLLIILAAPLSLFFLAYYFMNHTRRLSYLATYNPDAMRQFAWLPLNMHGYWKFPIGDTQYQSGPDEFSPAVSSWLLETLISAIILPIASLGILYFRLFEFGDVGIWKTALICLSAVLIIIMGIMSAKYISQARRILW